MSKNRSHPLAMYLAVLPKYRSECIALLKSEFGDDLELFVSPAHLDPSVTTGIPSNLYKEVRIVRLPGRRAFIQLGHWATAMNARALVVDLNPRSLTAWTLLFGRRLSAKRTLAWGHLYPQAGSTGATAWLRSVMRRLSDGTILYTYDNLKAARFDIPHGKTWVAPNALYRRSDISVSESTEVRTEVLYVGRLAPKKKVDLLLRGFSLFADEQPEARLTIVGAGSEAVRLGEIAEELNISDRVEFAGWVDSVDELAGYYSRAFCTVSPGFAGLGLTQSLGFGVPVAVARAEPHSPEIELANLDGAVSWFDSDSPGSLSSALSTMWQRRTAVPIAQLSAYIADSYSAEAMAAGLSSALSNKDQVFAEGVETR